MELSEIVEGLGTIRHTIEAMSGILPGNRALERDCEVCKEAQLKLAEDAGRTGQEKQTVTEEQLDRLARAAWGDTASVAWEYLREPFKDFYRGIAKRVVEAL